MNFPDLIQNMLYEIFSLIRKFLHFLFPLHDNCICMSIIVSEIFPRKSSILLVIICNAKFYHAHVRWKSSVLSENVSTSFQLYSNCIGMSIIVYEFSFSKNLHFKKFSYVILNFIIHMLDENLVLYKNVSTSFFNYILIVFLFLSLYLRFFFNFMSYPL